METQINKRNQSLRAITGQELEVLIPKEECSKNEARRFAQDEFRKVGWHGQRIIHTSDTRQSSRENAVNGSMVSWYVFEATVPFWRYKRAQLYWKIRDWIFTEKAQKLFGIKYKGC